MELSQALNWRTHNVTFGGPTLRLPDVDGQPVVLATTREATAYRDACLLLHGDVLLRMPSTFHALTVAMSLMDLPMHASMSRDLAVTGWQVACAAYPATPMVRHAVEEDGSMTRPRLVLPTRKSLELLVAGYGNARMRRRDSDAWLAECGGENYRYMSRRPATRMVAQRLLMHLAACDLQAHDVAMSCSQLADLLLRTMRALGAPRHCSAPVLSTQADGSLATFQFPQSLSLMATLQVETWTDLLDLMACMGHAPSGWPASPTHAVGFFPSGPQGLSRDGVEWRARLCGHACAWQARTADGSWPDAWTCEGLDWRMLQRVTRIRPRVWRRPPVPAAGAGHVRAVSLRGLE